MTIQFDTALTLQPAKTTTALTLTRFVDSPERKVVRAFFAELALPLILWEGETYDAAGQYTDSDIAARVREILATTAGTIPQQ